VEIDKLGPAAQVKTVPSGGRSIAGHEDRLLGTAVAQDFPYTFTYGRLDEAEDGWGFLIAGLQ
jgi:hypothetical protein